ncbi:VC2662 family protein [Psychromonas sp. Urea-02u-13]|uniref:VC2662 family protein n=1 Tax=Psychromonas sp. Urea-02u-13 TaxID=2058326 RepID=UPI000C327F95|nr:phaC PHA synthase [Psychromonas sp. Urea-02u-13]PKG40420.1 phaC PHA synthase [Psychromonas sp. Urea-02u-13]
MKKLLSAVAIISALSSISVQASQSTFMYSSLNGYNAPQAETVAGVRLALLHGEVNEVKGLDLAVIGMSETNKTTGVNLGIWGAAKVNQSMTGASLGLFNWIPGQTVGANLGIVNITGDVKGANLALMNYSEGDTVFDMAAVSISKSSTVQVGFVNMTDNIKGVQIGLLNCADNGFFKCFPIFNFAK